MGLIYKRATVEDIDVLTKTRTEVLLAANRLPEGTDMRRVERASYEYYLSAVPAGTHVAYLVFDGNRFVGAGGVSYYQVMPTYHNPSGMYAYIMNMYTRPEYRRRGVAYRTLQLLVQDARARGIDAIRLEATRMGRQLYERFGFVGLKDEMELPKR